MKKIVLVIGALWILGASPVSFARAWGLGANLTYITMDDSESLVPLGGSFETASGVGASVLAHVPLGNQNLWRYFATEVGLDLSRHDIRVKDTANSGNLNLGKALLFTASWTFLWMITPDWNFIPYVGMGPAFISMRSTDKGVADSIDFDSTFLAGVLQGGFKYYPQKNWSFDLSAKKFGLYRFKSSFRQDTISASTQKNNINPLTVGLGVTYFFE